ASFADIDNDGDPDLYATYVRAGNVLYENLGGGRFRDISAASGLDCRAHSSGAVFFDFDRDGRLDLFLTNVGRYTRDELARLETPEGPRSYHLGFDDAFAGHLKPDRQERSLLFRNEGGHRFTDVSDAAGLTDFRWTGDASPCDFNQDGWPDLYVLNMQGHDGYYENVEGRTFVDRSRERFPKTPWGAMGIKVFDWNNDGQMDLYLTDMHSDMSENVDPDEEHLKSTMQWSESFLRSGGHSIFGNAFFQADGAGGFDEVSDAVGAENYWPWGISVGDLNADGFDDVFVACSMNYPFRYSANRLLLNQRGERFIDAAFPLGLEPRRAGRYARPWFELDCAGADRDHRDCEGRTGPVTVWGSLGSRSSVLFDLDLDGDLDLVSNEFNDAPMVLISDLSDRKPGLRFLRIRLIGTASNRDGLGAVIRVVIGDRRLTRVVDGVSGYLSHSLVPLYVGLGEA
ncbi:MAG: CRTAC1 family protein, partial [Verrucomicrobiota bacterium]